MTSNHRTLIRLWAMLLLPAASFADETLRSGLARCAEIGSESLRLACYDELATGSRGASSGDRAVSEAASAPSAMPDPEPEPASEPAVVPLDDSVGRQPADTDGGTQSFAGRLTRCVRASPSSRTLYYLDNGQVWRQSDSGRKQIRDCDADIEITKDLFGFKMRVAGSDRSVRVSRIR